MKLFTRRAPRYRPIRRAHPQLKSQLLRDRHGKRVPTSRAQNDLYAQLMRASQRRHIHRRYRELGIEECAINIDGQQAKRKGHVPWILAFMFPFSSAISPFIRGCSWRCPCAKRARRL
jgi:hypothetical protein